LVGYALLAGGTAVHAANTFRWTTAAWRGAREPCLTAGVATGLCGRATDVRTGVDANVSTGTADVVTGAVDGAADTIAAPFTGWATDAGAGAIVGAALIANAGLIVGAAGATTKPGVVTASTIDAGLIRPATCVATARSRSATCATDAALPGGAASTPTGLIGWAALVSRASEAFSAALGRTGSINEAATGVVDACVASGATDASVGAGPLIAAASTAQAGLLRGAARVAAGEFEWTAGSART
jgi:hypothetical protein